MQREINIIIFFFLSMSVTNVIIFGAENLTLASSQYVFDCSDSHPISIVRITNSSEVWVAHGSSIDIINEHLKIVKTISSENCIDKLVCNNDIVCAYCKVNDTIEIYNIKQHNYIESFKLNSPATSIIMQGNLLYSVNAKQNILDIYDLLFD